eukprot:TRINITY_DN189_c0_g1_i2.p1 TRINITY_DN189_c0_g1~~TRINITY_DN189_c0_g1_i2.p1  ORF type:complete len:292 (+),score=106.68 TRINITY_DN189_c0_g1_i2:80-877(+)
MDQEKAKIDLFRKTLESETPQQRRERMLSKPSIMKEEEEEEPIKTPYEWTVEEVCNWLRQCQLHDLQKTIRDNQVSGQDLLFISKEELQSELRITLFRHRKNLWQNIEKLRAEMDQCDLQLSCSMTSSQLRQLEPPVANLVAKDLEEIKIVMQDHESAKVFDQRYMMEKADRRMAKDLQSQFDGIKRREFEDENMARELTGRPKKTMAETAEERQRRVDREERERKREKLQRIERKANMRSSQENQCGKEWNRRFQQILLTRFSR